MEHKGSIELRFARFVPKLAEDGGKLGVYFLLIGSVKFGGSSARGDAPGRWSLEKKSRLGNELDSIINQDMLQSSRLFGHYLLVVGVRLFVKNSECITNNGISLEKEWDWDFWDSPRNDWRSELKNVVGGQMRQKSVALTQQMTPFLKGAAVKLFVQYACVGVRNIVKIWSKTAVKGRFAARRTRFLVVGLAVSHFSAFSPVASAKNKGLARKLDKILTCSFLFTAWLISRLFDKKNTRKHMFGRSAA